MPGSTIAIFSMNVIAWDTHRVSLKNSLPTTDCSFTVMI